MSAKAGVIALIFTHIPYPNKYIEVGLKSDGLKARMGDKMYFKATAFNRGSITIEKVTGKIIISEIESNDTYTVPLTEVYSISPGYSDKLYAEWDTNTARPGKYGARAVVNYDGEETRSLVRYARVGDVVLEIINVTPNEVPAGAITPLDVEVRSIWNQKMSFSAKLLVKDKSGSVIGESTSALNEIQQWSTAQVRVFFDAKKLEVGEYDAEVIVSYAEKEARKTFKVLVTEKNVEVVEKSEVKPVEEQKAGTSMTPVLIIFAVFVLVALAYYAYGRMNRPDEDSF